MVHLRLMLAAVSSGSFNLVPISLCGASHMGAAGSRGRIWMLSLCLLLSISLGQILLVLLLFVVLYVVVVVVLARGQK